MYSILSGNERTEKLSEIRIYFPVFCLNQTERSYHKSLVMRPSREGIFQSVGYTIFIFNGFHRLM